MIIFAEVLIVVLVGGFISAVIRPGGAVGTVLFVGSLIVAGVVNRMLAKRNIWIITSLSQKEATDLILSVFSASRTDVTRSMNGFEVANKHAPEGKAASVHVEFTRTESGQTQVQVWNSYQRNAWQWCVMKQWRIERLFKERTPSIHAGGES